MVQYLEQAVDVGMVIARGLDIHLGFPPFMHLERDV
jgi:hypothetical protein